MILGLLFEILGALFLSMESIGLQIFSKYYNYIYRISKWSKKNILRMFLVMLPICSPVGFSIYFNNKVLIALLIPITILILASTIFIDHPTLFEKFVISKANDKKIGPIGFLLMIVGFSFQLISIIWQMILATPT